MKNTIIIAALILSFSFTLYSQQGEIDSGSSPDALRLRADAQTTLDFFTGNTMQYRIRKLGNGTGDFQFINENNSNTVWAVGGLGRMRLDNNGNLGLGTGAFGSSFKLHVNGNSDASLVEVTIEDDDFAFMRFDAALQSGIQFNTGNTTHANVWYRGNGAPGLILNTVGPGGTPHVFIEDNTGFVGLGDDTPDAAFDVEATNDGCNFGSRSGSSWGYVNTQRPAGSGNVVVQRWRDNTSTLVTVNELTDTYIFTVNGDALASGGTWANSDSKLKTNITDLGTGTLNKLMNLSPKKYDWTSDDQYKFLGLSNRKQIGFLAQDLEAEFPEVVLTSTQTDADGEAPVDHELKSVNYSAMIPVLTKAIQEQQEIIEALQSRIEVLEER